jgi:PAS domain S-box-containing protein
MYPNQEFFENFSLCFPKILDMLEELIVVLNPQKEFKLEYINQNLFLNKLGLSHNKIIGKSFLRLIHPKDKKIFTKNLKKVIKKSNKKQKFRLLGINRNPFWIEMDLKRISKDRIVCILRDTSLQKELEEKFKLNEEKFQKIANTIPEIRFWNLFTPKKHEDALQNSIQMLNMIMENIPQFIYWKDMNLNYFGCNKNYANLINIKSPGSIVAKNDNNSLWEKDQLDFILKNETEVLKLKKAQYHIIEYWKLKSGKEFWVDVNRIPLFNSEGNVVGLLVTFEDVSEKKLAEYQLKKSEKNYRNILESIKEGYFEIDLDGNFTFLNSSICNITRYSRKTLINSNYQILCDEIAKLKIFNILNELYRKGEGDRIFEFEQKTNNGEITHLESSVYLRYDAESKIIGFRGILRDITERKKAELLKQGFNQELKKEVDLRTQELKLANEKQQLYLDQILKTSYFKTKFLSIMSHELRTPLNAIIGFSELLLEEENGPLNKDQKEFIIDIKDSAEHQFDMIKHILDISKIESGQLTLNIQKFSLNFIVQQVKSSLRPMYNKKSLKFIVKGLDEEKKIYADLIRLKEILLNLLSNAIKYTIAGKIVLSIKENNNSWRFLLRDTGIGIAKKDYPLIFKEFSRINSPYVRSVPGSGLGLSLTKRLVELHGGQIEFCSVLGLGTTFLFTISKKLENTVIAKNQN